MKNKNQSTIDEANTSAGEIANEVTDAVTDVVTNVAQAALNVAETVSAIDETIDDVKEIAQSAPSLKDVMKAIVKDARVGHFIVDILNGVNVNEASKTHFYNETNNESQSTIDTLVDEAEQRGYLRGRNEQIEVKMRQSISPSETGKQTPCNEPSILSHIRRSVWDK